MLKKKRTKQLYKSCRLIEQKEAGVYIMQNTMVVGGGGNGCWGKKIKNEELGKKLKKGKKKGGKLHEKKGKKAIKFIFLDYKLQKFSRGGLPPCTPAPPCRILIRRKLP